VNARLGDWGVGVGEGGEEHSVGSVERVWVCVCVWGVGCFFLTLIATRNHEMEN